MQMRCNKPSLRKITNYTLIKTNQINNLPFEWAKKRENPN